MDAEPFTEPLADTLVLVAGTAGVTVVCVAPFTEPVMVAGSSARAWVSAYSTASPWAVTTPRAVLIGPCRLGLDEPG